MSVPALTLDELLGDNDISDVDLVKMDIEGAEWEVLRDGVAPRIRALIGELHASGARAPDELLRPLEESMTIQVMRGDAKRVAFVAHRGPSAQPPRGTAKTALSVDP